MRKAPAQKNCPTELLFAAELLLMKEKMEAGAEQLKNTF